jgi:type II secretory pathway pseudopilin PulG
MERGLTLGEMLVVLLVFSIMAVMFFISSNLAITKAKLASFSMDTKTLSKALASYEGEYFNVPTEDQGLEAVMRSPVSFLTQMPKDPFTPNGGPLEYGYYTDLSSKVRCILVSVGPDQVADVDRALTELDNRSGSGRAAKVMGRALRMSDKEAQDFIAKYSYDPTNGADSKGDVITVYGQ